MEIYLSRILQQLQTYVIMPENLHTDGQNQGKVIYEVVAFRYSDEASLMLVGEAEITIELFTDEETAVPNSTNLKSVWVDLLSVYDAEDRDVYLWVMGDPVLCRQLAKAALDHYLCPPSVPVGLPKRVREW